MLNGIFYTNRIVKEDYEGLPEYFEPDDLELLKNRLLNKQKVIDEIWSEIKKQLYGQ